MKGLIFTYAMTYGGAALSLLNPFYGFLIYVAFANLKPDSLWSFSVPQGGNYSRIVAFGFLLGWLLHGGGSWNFGKATSMVYSLLFFWGWIVLGAVISPAQDQAWAQLITLSKVYLPVIAGITLIDSVSRLRQLAWVLIATQGYLAYEFNLTYYSGFFNPNEFKALSMDNNSHAITMVTGVGIALFMGLHEDKWWKKVAAFLAAGLMAHFVLFSMSRGGMLALVITGAVAFWLVPKRPIHFAMLVAAALVVLRLAGPQVQAEFFTSFADEEHRDASAESRFLLTRQALTEMGKNPILGCGMENWGNVAPDYGWTKGKEVHNTWAQLGAELGIPGMVSILSFYLLGCWNLAKVAREKTPVEDPWLRYFARMVIAAIAGFLVSASLVTSEGIELPYYIMVLGAGTLKLFSLGVASSRSADPSVDMPLPLTAAAA
jgi:putative inorganic carbon (hco3(-)) transporter